MKHWPERLRFLAESLICHLKQLVSFASHRGLGARRVVGLPPAATRVRSHKAAAPWWSFTKDSDASKIENELGWKADENFETGIVKTVRWYLEKFKNK